MQYALLIYVTEATEAIPEEVMVAQREGYNAFSRHLRDRGAMLGGEALQPTASATTVRVVDGRTVTTDGPFADLLRRLERWSEAASAYRRALELTTNGPERTFLTDRLAAVDERIAPPVGARRVPPD